MATPDRVYAWMHLFNGVLFGGLLVVLIAILPRGGGMIQLLIGIAAVNTVMFLGSAAYYALRARRALTPGDSP